MQLEKDRAKNLEKEGIKWWQDSSNIPILNSPKQLHEYIANAKDKLVIAKFFAEDCYVCRSIHPKLQKIAASNPDIVFVKMNGTNPAFQGLFNDLGIQHVPWFHFYSGGKCVSSMSASLSPEKLAAFRAEIAAHRISRRMHAEMAS